MKYDDCSLSSEVNRLTQFVVTVKNTMKQMEQDFELRVMSLSTKTSPLGMVLLPVGEGFSGKEFVGNVCVFKIDVLWEWKACCGSLSVIFALGIRLCVR